MTDSTAAEQNDELGEAGKRALEAERAARKEAERRAREAEERIAAIELEKARADVAAKKGLSEAQAGLLRGQSAEELESEADKLLAAFPREEKDSLERRPRERLRPGATSSTEEPDLGSVADEIVRGL
jgi:hypothetical protein